MMFLTLPCQGTTPQLLKLKFPMQTWGPKQKCKFKKKKLFAFTMYATNISIAFFDEIKYL